MFRSLINYQNPNSLVVRARKKRFNFFLNELNKLSKPLRILDIGGTQKYWEMMDFKASEKIEIHLLNLESETISNPFFKSFKGDATDLSNYDNNEYDLIYSNSVIEHMFTWDNQVRMAKEIRRVGRNYFVQTPNYWFPIEPHFVFPFFQYLPRSMKIWLVANFSLGHHKKYDNKEIAKEKVDEVKLLSVNKMKKLFPDGNLHLEKFMGFNKSIIAFCIKI